MPYSVESKPLSCVSCSELHDPRVAHTDSERTCQGVKKGVDLRPLEYNNAMLIGSLSAAPCVTGHWHTDSRPWLAALVTAIREYRLLLQSAYLPR